MKLAKESAAGSADRVQYEEFLAMKKSQHYYPNVFSLIIGKRYATVNEELSAVTITDGAYTKTVEFTFNARPLIDGQEDPDFGGENGSSGSSSSSGSSQGGSQAGGSTGGNTGGDPNPNPDGPSE